MNARFQTTHWSLPSSSPRARLHAEEARKAFEERLAKAPDDDFRHLWLGVALARVRRMPRSGKADEPWS